jgi:RimJ/RimL family protein N-acetyltransferase
LAEGLPTLAGRGLRLRQLVPADATALFAVFSDPQVMRFWSRAPMREAAEAETLLRHIEAGWRADTLYEWGIVPDGTDTVIGTATLFAIERAHRRAEIGFALGSRWWRRGLGLAAVGCLLRHAFGDLGLERLEADVDPRNAGSLALLGRLGFRREGLLRARFRVGGEIQDSVILGLLHEEWVARG